MAHSLEEALAAVGLGAERGPRRAATWSAAGPADEDPAPARPHWLAPRTVGITRHAVERFRERVSSGLDHRRAQEQLASLLFEKGSVTFVPDSRPHPSHPRENRMCGYLIVDHDIVLPLKESRDLPDALGHRPSQPFYVVTCLNRSYWEEHWVEPA